MGARTEKEISRLKIGKFMLNKCTEVLYLEY